MEIGQRIQAARDRAVLTRTELARMVDMSYDSILLIETGRRNPSRKAIRAIATALGVEPYTLLVDIHA